MQTHILGFPRIGANREHKRLLEAYWRGQATRQDLLDMGQELRRRHWTIQGKAGLTHVTTGDFSLYDHVLDTSLMLGAIPERFLTTDQPDLDTYFCMARGDAERNVPALDMTKWFNTNYHYMVPEISAAPLKSGSQTIVRDTLQALDLGCSAKPVLLGPITYLSLAKGVKGFDPWNKLDEVLNRYTHVLDKLRPLCPWIQIDEPILCADMSPAARAAFPHAYKILNQAGAKLLLTTYFDALDDNMDLALTSGCAGLHTDLTRGARALDSILTGLPREMTLSVGIVDGRNIWKTDLDRALRTLDIVHAGLGADRIMLASSCSLLHTPVDLELETALPKELKGWMAFAVQKCAELRLLARAMNGEDCAAELEANAISMRSRRQSPQVTIAAVRERCARVDEKMTRRNAPYPARKNAQSWLGLPLLPTTTIGSFPQTPEIRKQRSLFRNGDITTQDYEASMRDEINKVVGIQEDLGLDVLVHGEAERNDMVEYFGQQLDGFCFTANGWVQSYGSRCVKPPIIHGDIDRPMPMTVKWITYAQSLTKKTMKGMLTGPVTIMCWSFVRDDMERAEVCRQLALAIRQEVTDLEKAGIRIIQIDEAAFSEGMPIKSRDKGAYLEWAVENFRLATSGVADSTQIHSHMCYSEFNDIVQSIAAMDADVISIESSRSGMELLEAFRDYAYPNEIGPGVYDIHSPRVPSAEEMESLLRCALEFIPKERLWVNPDCGLKTRDWPETLASLRNMVEAARRVRASLS